MEFKPANRKECSIALGSNLTLKMAYAPNFMCEDEITCAYTIVNGDTVIASSYSTFDPTDDVEWKMKCAGVRFANNFITNQLAVMERASQKIKPLVLMYGIKG